MSEVAIVYDGSIRDNGTPRYFREAFAEVLGREVPWYTQASEIPTGRAFYFHVDDGRDDLTAVPPWPFGYYATDTHITAGPRLEKARKATIVWTAQKDAAEKYQAEGIFAKWLPLACAPLHHPTAVEVSEQEGSPLAEKRWDIGFVGHLQDPKLTDRISFLDALFKGVPSFRVEFGAFGRDFAKVMHQCRIGINHSVAKGEQKDLNMRTFELASMGIPQLCDQRQMGLKDAGFEAWQHYIPYGGPWPENSVAEDAIGAVKWSLRNSGGLPAMAKRAHDLVRGSHTYAHRVRQMLRDASELIGVDLCSNNEGVSTAEPSTTRTTTTSPNVLSVEIR